MLGSNGDKRTNPRDEERPIRKVYLSLRKITNIRSLVKGSDDYRQRPKKRP